MARVLRKLLHSNNALAPLAWWKEVFGRDFPAVRSFLSPRTGRLSSTYPCVEDPSVSYRIRESDSKYRAFPTGENADDFDDLELEWKDVQAWDFDAAAFTVGLKDTLGLQESPAPDLQGLVPIGKCTHTGASHHVYACFAPSESDALKAIISLPSNQGIGCILFPERHLAVDELLQTRGIGSVPLCECFSLENGDLAGGCSQACTKNGQQNLTNQELKSHFDHRFNTLGVEYASLKEENIALKKDLASSIAAIAGKVEPEYFQWVFTILGAGSVSAAAKLLDIPNSSFSAKLKQYASRGGVYATLFDMTKVRKGCGVKSVVGFDETFVEHQPESGVDPTHVRDLLDGLENLNANNWPDLRDELIELVQEELL